MSAPVTTRAVGIHALPAMLTALRLPSFQRHWQPLAERADTEEGWPAARLLAALAEIELAERDARRIQRHLNQPGLPGGKTRRPALPTGRTSNVGSMEKSHPSQMSNARISDPS